MLEPSRKIAKSLRIQRKDREVWPVVVEQNAPGQYLPMRIEGHFQLDLNLLHTHPMSLEYGTILGQALFSAKIKDAFLQALATSGNALCVLLCIEADELKSLHWQSLCGPLDNQWSYLALNQRTLFSHYLPAATDRRFPLIERSDLRGLAIVASPTGLDGYGLTPFNVAETVAYLRSSFGSIPLDILADTTDTVGAPTLDAFCAQIVAKRYSLVHVVCHGAYHREEREMSLFLSWPGRGRCRRQMRRLCCPSEQKTSNKMRTPGLLLLIWRLSRNQPSRPPLEDRLVIP